MLTVTVHRSDKPGTISQQFLVLGSQSVAELRDRIYCPADHIALSHGVSKPSG